MNKLSITAAVMVAIVSCQTLERGFNYTNGYTHERDQGQSDDSGSGQDSPGVAAPDTTVWITAVSLSEGYDWRRDSSYYLSQGEIIVYKDFVRQFSVPAGRSRHVSLASDMHFMLDGVLFTQFSMSGHSYIGRNGRIILDYQGEEIIRGLAVQEDDVLTVGSDRNGRGFKFRRNGNIVLSETEGSVWGGLGDPSFPATGALYQVDTSLHFCWNRVSGNSTSWYLAGTASAASSRFELPSGCSSLIDLRYGEKGPVCIGSFSDGSLKMSYDGKSTTILSRAVGNIESCRLYGNEEGGYGAVLRYSNDGPCMIWKGGLSTVISQTGLDYIVCSGEQYVGIRRGTDRISIVWGDGRKATINGSYYLFNRHCICPCGNSLYLVLTPVEKGGKPVLWKDGKLTEIDMDGYLSGVYAELSPASL